MNHLKFLAKWCTAKSVQSWWIYGSLYSLVFIPKPPIFPNFIACLLYGCPHFPFFHSLPHSFTIFLFRSFALLLFFRSFLCSNAIEWSSNGFDLNRWKGHWQTLCRHMNDHFKWTHQFQIVCYFEPSKHTLNISLFGDIVRRAHSKQIPIFHPISELISNFSENWCGAGKKSERVCMTLPASWHI